LFDLSDPVTVLGNNCWLIGRDTVDRQEQYMIKQTSLSHRPVI